jgi:hypothetical protein
MSTSTPPAGGGQQWPEAKLTALRLGQRLVAEVPASRADRRAFIDITPVRTPADNEASRDGWKRTDSTRTFRMQHWEYHADRIAGFDYDIGSVLIRTATVTGEPELVNTLDTWQLRPEQLLYPWQTDDPK